jgi:hypothetical protein
MDMVTIYDLSVYQNHIRFKHCVGKRTKETGIKAAEKSEEERNFRKVRKIKRYCTCSSVQHILLQYIYLKNSLIIQEENTKKIISVSYLYM